MGSDTPNRGGQTLRIIHQYLTLSVTDSIPLFSDSLVFEQFDVNAKGDRILLGGEYSGIYELNRSTDELRRIANVGSNYGEINISLFTLKYLPDNRIMVAELLTGGKIYIFDEMRQLVYTEKYSDIFPVDKGGMAPFVCSNIDVLESSNDSTIIGLGVMEIPQGALGWEAGDCYAKLLVHKNAVTFLSSHFPLQENTLMKNAATNGIEYSPFSIPRIANDENYIYLKFIFDNDIYLANRRFSLVKKISFQPVYKTFDYYIESEAERGAAANIRQNFCNLFVESFALLNNRAFLIYPKPVSPENAPASIEEVREKESGDRDRVLHIINLTNNEHSIVNLPAKVDGHNLIVRNDHTIFLLGNKHYQQDTYIYIAETK